MTTPAHPLLSAAAAAAHLLSLLEGGSSAALVMAVPGEAREGLPLRMVVPAGDDAGIGSLGDAVLDAAASALAQAALNPATGGGAPEGGPVKEGIHSLAAADGSVVRLYLEVHHPPAELVIVGAGHIAIPLAEMGAVLGFRVTVLDDRPTFATRERFPRAAQVRVVDFHDPFAGLLLHAGTHLILVTRGHKYDYECLRRVLVSGARPGYIGLIGSRRRVRATFLQLLEEGIPRERIAGVRAPVGLDLGAETPAEIAVAVAAEMVLLRRGGSGTPLRDAERILDRFFPLKESLT